MTRFGRWLYGMRKIAAGVVPVIILCLLGQFVLGFEDIQLWTIYGTLPFTAAFIIAYVPERPHRHWFGTSLLLLAFAVLAVIITALLVRIVDPLFWGRQWLVTFWLGLTYSSMAMRTFVLLGDQRRDRRGFGWWLTCQYRRVAALFIR